VAWATVGDFFGRKSFATIRGTMSFFYLWGPALGPVVTGAIYDRYHSYAPNDVRLFRSFSDCKLSLRLASKAASAFPLGRAAV